MAPTKENPRQHWLKELVRTRFEGSLKAFSEKTKMDYTGLNLMVNGRRAISEKMVIRICNRLKVAPPEGMEAIAIESKVLPDAQPKEPDTFAQERAQYLAIIDRQSKTIEAMGRRLDKFSELAEKLDRIYGQKQ